MLDADRRALAAAMECSSGPKQAHSGGSQRGVSQELTHSSETLHQISPRAFAFPLAAAAASAVRQAGA
ncbi:hypothetical protein A9977_27760 [Variovorax sp. UMC13]|nr:hypothetical protein [Variovorax sp. UMC13]